MGFKVKTGLSPVSVSDSTVSSSSTSTSTIRSSAAAAARERPQRSASLSERACRKCHTSKRRCDKTLPVCGRCTRLAAKCIYGADTAPGASRKTPVLVYQPQSLPSSDLLLRRSHPLADVSAPWILSLISGDARPSECLDWADAARSYFQYVYGWYAVVHRRLFEQRVASLGSAANSPVSPAYLSPASNSFSADKAFSAAGGLADQGPALEPMDREFALLILTMHLSARMRCTGDGNRTMFDAVYQFAKRMLALSFSEHPVPKIELIQAAALLALYEYGHGDSLAAFRTLSDAVAAARVTGITPGGEKLGSTDSFQGIMSMEEEQKNGLWWSLFILDQIIHRDETSKHLPFVLESPSPRTNLPGSMPVPPAPARLGVYDVKYLCDPGCQRLSVDSTVDLSSLEGFQVSAKAATLLHRALQHEHGARTRLSGALPQVGEFAALDQEIRQMTLALLQDSVDWRFALDCFAMCVSALFSLYFPFLPVLQSKSAAEIEADEQLWTALAALRFATQMSSDITCKMNAESKASGQEMTFRELPAPAAPTCYLVVVAYAGLRNIHPEDHAKCQEAIVDKYDSLKFFGQRWGIADKMMHQLEAVLGPDWHSSDSAGGLSPQQSDGLAHTLPGR